MTCPDCKLMEPPAKDCSCLNEYGANPDCPYCDGRGFTCDWCPADVEAAHYDRKLEDKRGL